MLRDGEQLSVPSFCRKSLPVATVSDRMCFTCVNGAAGETQPCCAGFPHPPHVSPDADFARRTAALQTSLKDFLHPPPKGEGANRRNSVLAELQGPAANRAQYAAISSFSPDSWLTTAVFPHLKRLLPSLCMTHVTRFCFLNVPCISLHRAVLFQDAMSTIRSTTSCLNSGDSVIK